MKTLTPAQRSEFRARAHRLHPVAAIGQKGLTPSLLEEIGRCLHAHELIKVRVLGEERETREELLSAICNATGATAVQHIGNILVLFREKPAQPEPELQTQRKPRRPTRAHATPPTRGKPNVPANPRRRLSAKRP